MLIEGAIMLVPKFTTVMLKIMLVYAHSTWSNLATILSPGCTKPWTGFRIGLDSGLDGIKSFPLT